MKYILLFILPLFIALFSCSEEELEIPEASKEIIGYWVNPQFVDTIYTYDRASKLKADDYGFEIHTNGEFLERWCGTPPISYSDYKGKWSLQDSILDIKVAFWGGTGHYKWKVLSVDKEKLSVVMIETKYEYTDDRFK